MDVFLAGFSKKLLVATCILVIIAMCLTQAEAASIAHKKQKRSENMTKLTKEQSLEQITEEHAKHRRRHQRHQPKTKDTIQNIYVSKMDSVVRKLGHTLSAFNNECYKLNESDMFRSSEIKLPFTNFTEILFHNYKNNNTSGMKLSERKFKYLLPKLYTSLMSYHEIFKFLAKIDTPSIDVLFNNYLVRRRPFYTGTINKLYSTMEEIRNSLEKVGMKVPEKNNTIYLGMFKNRVNEVECQTYDGTVLKGYRNLLSRWKCVVTTPKNRTRKENKRCGKFKSNLKRKRPQKKQKTRRRPSRTPSVRLNM
ncbi:uncharacterized protein ACR2FA_000883 [Aphomia sociella]